jgi:hypothetical protein
MTSPPFSVTKKFVLKFRSQSNIVKPPAKTGRDNTNITAVINNAHRYKETCLNGIDFARQRKTVVIKLIEPIIEAAPETCKERIPKSAENLFLNPRRESGG